MPKVVPRTKQGKDIDKFFKKITVTVKAGDVVIPVLGPTGPGKSTFINNVLGGNAKKRARVSDGLASCTLVCETYAVDGPLQRNADYASIAGKLVLVDTPGFDDSRMSDSEVVEEITKSLNSLYSKKGVAVAGIVYMLPIFPARSTASSQSNLKAFEKVSSGASSTVIALVTTRWNLCTEEVGKKREAELRKRMWGDIEDDSLVARLRDDPESAWAVVDSIIHKFVEKRSTTQTAGSPRDKGGASTSKAGQSGTAAARKPPADAKKGAKSQNSSTQAPVATGSGATPTPAVGSSTGQASTGKGGKKEKSAKKSSDKRTKQGKGSASGSGPASGKNSGKGAKTSDKSSGKQPEQGVVGESSASGASSGKITKKAQTADGNPKQGIFGRLKSALLSLIRRSPPPGPKTSSK